MEYDGTAFYGWQIQPDHPTVQGTIEEALKRILREQVSLISAGRTDAGVHALGQVANFHTRTKLDPENIRGALNSLLREDIVARDVEEVPETFHARFDAKSRLYRYTLSKSKRAVGRAYSWHVKYPLDLSRMDEASRCLLGRHNFVAFCKKSSETEGFCTVLRCVWSERAEEIRFEIEADRFLHHMVRAIVGTMVEVGRVRISPSAVREILTSGERRRAGPTVPPHGLCLVGVTY